jgi:hypothetical protein
MNAKSFVVLCVAVLMPGLCTATNVGLGTIEQPVNLGADSDPSRIPLGRVATESNYYYGRGPVISAARPSLHGAMEWKDGSELDQNLASVFGIEVSNHDLPYSPATIHLKARPVPPYSPYTKDQVLAATIHCLLRSNRGTSKQPIQLQITADSPADQALVSKYSGEFINAPDDSDAPPVDPTPVRGTRLETDHQGTTWVVFPDIKPTPDFTPHPPVLIPFRLGGEFGPDHPQWRLLPVWTGSGHTWPESLEIIGRPYPLFYDCFNPSTGAGPEANALFAADPRGSLSRFDVSETDAIKVLIRYPDIPTETLAATILALVVSSQPTTEHPLTVTLETGIETPPEWFHHFKSCPEWTSMDGSQQIAGRVTQSRLLLSCTFVWDAKSATLNRGAVPAASVIRATNGELVIEGSPLERAIPNPNLPETDDSGNDE